jgi:hypothetical protein
MLRPAFASAGPLAAAHDTAVNTALNQSVWAAGVLVSRSSTEPTTVIVYIATKDMKVPVPDASML